MSIYNYNIIMEDMSSDQSTNLLKLDGWLHQNQLATGGETHNFIHWDTRLMIPDVERFIFSHK